jgi:hypothetical protein
LPWSLPRVRRAVNRWRPYPRGDRPPLERTRKSARFPEKGVVRGYFPPDLRTGSGGPEVSSI